MFVLFTNYGVHDITLSRVSPILSRVSLRVGANFLDVYIGRYHRSTFIQTIKTPNAKKAQKVWAFCIEKVPTKRIIS